MPKYNAIKAYCAHGVKVQCILDPSTRWSGHLHTMITLPPGKEPLVPLERMPGELQRWFQCGDRKNSYPCRK